MVTKLSIFRLDKKDPESQEFEKMSHPAKLQQIIAVVNLNQVWKFCGILLLQYYQPEAAKFFSRAQLVNDVSLHNRTTAHCEYTAIQSTYSIVRDLRPRKVPADISDMLLLCKWLSKEQMLSLVLLYVTKREEKK